MRVLLALILCVLALPALAAPERSRLDVLGFSADGRFFAYQQSGIEENSAMAYADLFIVDTKDDSWVQGTPLRVRSVDLAHARTSVTQQAARLMRRLGLNRAQAGVAVVPKDRNLMWVDLPWDEKAALQLSPKAGLAAPGCPVTMPIVKGSLRGLHLTMQRPSGAEILYSDRLIPRVRGCALSYRFASGFMKQRGNNEAVLASVIAYREQTSAHTTRVRYMALTSVVKR